MKLSELDKSEVIPVEDNVPLSLSKIGSEVVPVSEAEGPGAAESFARGAGQWGTFELADEAIGSGYALKDALAKGTLSDVVKDYIRHKDEYEKNNDLAWKNNPVAYGTGAAVGGLASALVPGAILGRAAKTGLTAGKIAGMAGTGALAGFGSSEASIAKGEGGQVLKDTLTGAAVAPVVGVAAEKAIPAIFGAAKKGASKLGKASLNAGFDIPEEVTERYLANPEAVNNALPIEGAAQGLADTFSEARGRSGELHKAAMSALSPDNLPGGMNVSDAIAVLDKYDDAAATQLKSRFTEELRQRTSDIARKPGYDVLSEVDTHELKKVLQDLGDFQSAIPKSAKAIANQDSGMINARLRASNEPYANTMSELAENIQAKKGLATKFGIIPDQAQESGFTFTDRTMSGMRDLIRNNKVDKERVLEDLKRLGYDDMAEEIRNSLAKDALQAGGRPNGSRRTALGGFTGAFLGPAGAAVGAAAGFGIDKYGPQIGKKLLDGAVLAQKLMRSPSAKRFAGAIQKAQAAGPAALASTHFLLSSTEPEYQKAVSEEDDEQQR